MGDYGDTCINTGDTAWVLLSFILVLGMTPALALFEAGLLRSKNTLSLITQMLSGLVVLSVMWDLFGFSLVYGPDQGGVIGNFAYGLLIDVSYFECSPVYGPTIPMAAFAMFQMMFAAISPLLMSGAVAERMRYRSFFVMIVLWEILVYYPVAHWIWGGGWMAKLGVQDFAGGIVIHTTAGASSLVVALMLGQRKGFEKVNGEFPPSNIPLAAVGAALLWIGWFGFNAGSALSASGIAASAVSSTQIGCSTSAMVWLIISWIRHKPSSIALMNGAIAGLAGITPASGFINSQASLILGVCLGLGSYGSVMLLKHKLHIDDALDVSSVHGFTGVIGAIAIGFAGLKVVNPAGADGLIYGDHSPYLLGVQVMGVVVAGAWASLITFLICVLLKKTPIGLRIDEANEESGMDAVEHSETAYHELIIQSNDITRRLLPMHYQTDA